ncbi:MAG: diguanylate cyclase [Clostridiales bacterium]|nr:diguanylate cyclase [Clostridiales bacterium]
MIKIDFIKATEKLWKDYFWKPTMEINAFDPECVIIGTGKHEFYTNLHEFENNFSKEVEDRKNIKFQFKDFCCEQKKISDDAYLVYGSLYIWAENEEQNIHINMDSRFSIIYKKREDGWKVVHVHQSMPNMEQLEGEYYPKTLTEQIQEKQVELKELEQIANKDGLTGLINYRALENFFVKQKNENAWIFIIDLDNFKHINDTYGHVIGNHILQKIAAVLSSTVRSKDVVCRMGGDEFVLYCRELKDETAAGEFMQRILKNIEEAGKDERCWIGMSMGATPVYENESLEIALKRADGALYEVKSNGKNSGKIQL